MKRIVDFRFWILERGGNQDNPKSKIQNPKCAVLARILLASGAWFFLLSPVVAMACPFCTEGLLSPGDAQASSRVAQGYDLSILMLMSMPFVLVGIVTWVIVRSARRVSTRR